VHAFDVAWNLHLVVGNIRPASRFRGKTRTTNLSIARNIVFLVVALIHDVDIENGSGLHFVSSRRALQLNEQLSAVANSLVVRTNVFSLLVDIPQAYPVGARACAFTTGIPIGTDVVLHERYGHRTVVRVNRLHIDRERLVRFTGVVLQNLDAALSVEDTLCRSRTECRFRCGGACSRPRSGPSGRPSSGTGSRSTGRCRSDKREYL
jgi:hypothetical protein